MSLVHPLKQQQRSQFYPFTVTIKELERDPLDDIKTSGGYADVVGLVDLKCAYVSSPGNLQDGFEFEAASQERILLQQPYDGIKPRQRAVLTILGQEKWFEIEDVLLLAQANQMLLVVVPVN